MNTKNVEIPPKTDSNWPNTLLILTVLSIILYLYVLCLSSSIFEIIAITLFIIGPSMLLLFNYIYMKCKLVIHVTNSNLEITKLIFGIKYRKLIISRNDIESIYFDLLPSFPSLKYRHIEGYNQSKLWGGNYFIGSYSTFTSGYGVLLKSTHGDNYIICDHLSKEISEEKTIALNDLLLRSE